jgi:hypothetical protein
MAKDKRIEFRCSDGEHEIIKAKAEKLNMDTSDYIRFVAVNAMLSISVGKTPEQRLIDNLKGIELVRKHGGIDTSEELLESRTEQFYNEYRKEVGITDGIVKKAKSYGQHGSGK